MEHIKNTIENGIKYPDNLTEKDRELILQQCKIQNALKNEQIQGFANAYSHAKKIALNEKELKKLALEDNITDLICELAVMIENRNDKNKNNELEGIQRVARTTNVVFRDSSTVLSWEKIPQAMKSFCEAYSRFIKNPIEDEWLNITKLYKEYLQIHPVEDGNGRSGDLLWKIATTAKTNAWPEELPPNIFNENRDLIN